MCLRSFRVPYLLFGDANVAQVRFEGLVRLLGKHPVAAERLTEHGRQQEVGLLRVVHHDHEQRHRHDQTGGDQGLPLQRERDRETERESECESERALKNKQDKRIQLMQLIA